MTQHTGLMHCTCAHNLGFLRIPLDKRLNHRNGKCLWTCCGQNWHIEFCSEISASQTENFNEHTNLPAEFNMKWQPISNSNLNSDGDFDVGEHKVNEDDIPWNILRIQSSKLERLEKSGRNAQNYREMHRSADEPQLIKTDVTSCSDKLNTDNEGKEAVLHGNVASQEQSEICGLSDDKYDRQKKPDSRREDKKALLIKTPISSKSCAAAENSIIVLRNMLYRLFYRKKYHKEILNYEFNFGMRYHDELRRNAEIVLAKLDGIMNDSRDEYMETIVKWFDEAFRAWIRVFGESPEYSLFDGSNDCLELLKHLQLQLCDANADCYQVDTAISLHSTTMEISFQTIYPSALVLAEVSLKASAYSSKIITRDSFGQWYVQRRLDSTIFSAPYIDQLPLLSPDAVFKSATAKILREERSLAMKQYGLKTSRGITFDDITEVAVAHPHVEVGAVLMDEYSFATFQEFFSSLILKIGVCRQSQSEINPIVITHGGKVDIDPSRLLLPDPLTDNLLEAIPSDWRAHVIGIRLRAHRNICDIPFLPNCRRPQRQKVEEIINAALLRLRISGQFRGNYRSIATSSSTRFEEVGRFGYPLIHKRKVVSSRSYDEVFLAGGGRDWPLERGFFLEENGGFVIWINEEGVTLSKAFALPSRHFTVTDHMIVEVARGFDFGHDVEPDSISEAFCCLGFVLRELESSLHSASSVRFLWDSDTGYHTSSPLHLGAAFQASAIISVPLLLFSDREPEFAPLAEKLGFDYMILNHQEGQVEICTRVSFGVSETEIVQTLINGISVLVSVECALAKPSTLPPLIQQLKTYDFGVSLPDSARRIFPREVLLTELSLAPPLAIENETMPSLVHPDSTLSRILSPSMYTSLFHQPPTFLGNRLVDMICDRNDIEWENGGVCIRDEFFIDQGAAVLMPILSEIHGRTIAVTPRDLDVARIAHLFADNFAAELKATPNPMLLDFEVRIWRCVSGFSFPHSLSRISRRLLQTLLTDVLREATAQLQLSARIIDLKNLSHAERTSLVEMDVETELLSKPALWRIHSYDMEHDATNDDKSNLDDTVLGEALSDALREWPDGRSLLVSSRVRDMHVLVNGPKAHLELAFRASLPHSGATYDINIWDEMPCILERADRFMKATEAALRRMGFNFASSDDVGFLTSYPNLIGTAVHFNATMFFQTIGPLSLYADDVRSVCKYLRVEVDEIHSNTPVGEQLCWHIFQKRVIDSTTEEAARNMVDTIVALSKLERLRTLSQNGFIALAELLPHRVPIPTLVLRTVSQIVPIKNTDTPTLKDPVTQPKPTKFQTPTKPVRQLYGQMPGSYLDMDSASICSEATDSDVVNNGGFFAVAYEPSTAEELEIQESVARSFGLSSRSPFEGEILLKEVEWAISRKVMGTFFRKAKQNMTGTFRPRFMWIDPSRMLFYWSKCGNRSKAKAFNLARVQNIRNISNQSLAQGAEITDGPICMRITLATSDVFTFQIPATLDKDKKKDWLLALAALADLPKKMAESKKDRTVEDECAHGGLTENKG